MAIKKYYDSDCNLGVLDGKTMPTLRTWPRAASMSSSACARALPTGKRLPSSQRLTPTSRSWKWKRLPRLATLS